MNRGVAKVRLVRLAKRGLAMERAWDLAVATGDEAKKATLLKDLAAYDRALNRYESSGLRITVLNGEVVAV